jgi:hypothetical protein
LFRNADEGQGSQRTVVPVMVMMMMMDIDLKRPGCELDLKHQYSTGLKNEWMFTSTPKLVFKLWHSNKDWDKFTVYDHQLNDMMMSSSPRKMENVF